MKKIHQLAILFSLICALTGAHRAPAQERQCGSVVSKAQFEQEKIKMATGALTTLPPDALPFHLPVTIHICRRADGTGGISLAQVDSAMKYLKQGLNVVGFDFFQYGPVIYINSDVFHDVLDSASRSQLRQQASVPNTINVFFTNLDPTLCGESSFPADAVQGIVMDSTCAGSLSNPTSFPHEVGHYLDLYHTHETKFGAECPNGTNCSTAGDLLCDTPADPGLSDSVNASCVYIGTAKSSSACGSAPYNPPVNNLMSYSRKVCRTNVTPGQVTRMMATMSGSRANLHAHVRYVDATWNGNQFGTPQEPFRSIFAALLNAGPLDFIFVRVGSYPESFVTNSAVSATVDRWEQFGSVVMGQ